MNKTLWTTALWLLAAIAPAHDAHAWGAKGHRLTALIAEQLLSPSALAQTKLILGGMSLASASVDMDVNRPALAASHPGSDKWHYDDRPTCDADAPKTHYCQGEHCASAKLIQYSRTLMNVQSSVATKRFALLIVTHLAGDIHQPLHAADHDDDGGNGILLTGIWDKKPKLHTVWDTDFVRLALERQKLKDKSDREIAAILAAQISDADKEGWRKGRVDAWMQESYDLAVGTAYGALPDFACEVFKSGGKKITLSDTYIDKSVALIPDQLKKGGVRLAAILNRALSSPADAAKGFVRAGKL